MVPFRLAGEHPADVIARLDLKSADTQGNAIRHHITTNRQRSFELGRQFLAVNQPAVKHYPTSVPPSADGSPVMPKAGFGAPANQTALYAACQSALPPGGIRAYF